MQIFQRSFLTIIVLHISPCVAQDQIDSIETWTNLTSTCNIQEPSDTILNNTWTPCAKSGEVCEQNCVKIRFGAGDDWVIGKHKGWFLCTVDELQLLDQSALRFDPSSIQCECLATDVETITDKTISFVKRKLKDSSISSKNPEYLLRDENDMVKVWMEMESESLNEEDVQLAREVSADNTALLIAHKMIQRHQVQQVINVHKLWPLLQDPPSLITWLYDVTTLKDRVGNNFASCPELNNHFTDAIEFWKIQEMFQRHCKENVYLENVEKTRLVETQPIEIKWSKCGNETETCSQCSGQKVRFHGKEWKVVDRSTLPEEFECSTECQCGVVVDMDYMAKALFDAIDMVAPIDKTNGFNGIPEWVISSLEFFPNFLGYHVPDPILNKWSNSHFEYVFFKFQALQIDWMMNQLFELHWEKFMKKANHLWRAAKQNGFHEQCGNLLFRFEEAIRGRMNWVHCRPESGGHCYCDHAPVNLTAKDALQVRYGDAATDRWRFVQASSRNGVDCSNSVFGDPAPYKKKECQCGFPNVERYSINSPSMSGSLHI